MPRPTLIASALVFSAQIYLSNAQDPHLELNLNDLSSIKKAASTISSDLAGYVPTDPFDGIGLLPEEYPFWVSAAYWNGLLDNAYMTGNHGYNNISTQALLAQRGPNDDFMPLNQTKNEGNDDQGFWALAALSADDYGVPMSPASENDTQPTSWMQMAQNVFDEQVARWDDQSCDGGLRWQIFTFNNGYNYKNSVSQGTFFQLAARLATKTGNKTYADWADKSYSWMESSGLIARPSMSNTSSASPTVIYDGTSTEDCSDINKIQWTLPLGLFLRGVSTLRGSSFDTPNVSPWADRSSALTDTAFNTFFGDDNVLFESACGGSTGPDMDSRCNLEQRAYRYYLVSALANLVVQHPDDKTHAFDQVLNATATAVARNCLGNGTCGMNWRKDAYDGVNSVGEGLAAMGVLNALGISRGLGEFANGTEVKPTASATGTGGTSAPTATTPASVAGLGRQEWLDGSLLAAAVAVAGMAALL
ncbi:MAG: hypothetical protein Q9160_008898 [Pyrenula sp. 1 TL-2023]